MSIVCPIRALRMPTGKRALLVLVASFVVTVTGSTMMDDVSPAETSRIAKSPPPLQDESLPEAPAPSLPDQTVARAEEASPYAGLGVSRTTIRSTLASLGRKIEYSEEAPWASGEPTMVGGVVYPPLVLGLTGRPDNLKRIDVVFGPGPPEDPDAKKFIADVVMMTLLLATPNWDNANEWIVEALESGAEETVHFRDGRKITLAIDEDAKNSVATLTVERQ